MDGLAPNGQYFLGVILSISSTTIILKTFDELGVKSQKFAGIVIVAYRSRHCSHFNDGFTIDCCSKSAIFWNGIAICIEISFPDCMVCGWYFFIPTLLKKS
jgi:CPA2 family monovalent cation:H+ antiporter-2